MIQLVMMACALSPLSTPGPVLTVDPTGGGHFLDIQSAVDAAVNGTTIVVQSGTYGTVVIDAKDLWLGSAVGAVVRVDGGVRVVDTAASQSVTLAGLDVFGVNTSTSLEGIGLYVDGNLGVVTAESCTFTGADGDDGNSCFPLGQIDGYTGAVLQDSVQVTLVSCVVQGGAGAGPGTGSPCPSSPAGNGAVGLEMIDTGLTLCAVTAAGGNGGPTGVDSGNGGIGLHVKGVKGVVTSVNSSFVGGDGGPAWHPPFANSGNGANGLQLRYDSTLTSWGDVLYSGDPGPIVASCCQGSPGSPLGGFGSITFNFPYCAAGTSGSGCNASISTSGAPSTSAADGFLLSVDGVEGGKQGLFFFGTNGRQANPWGNGTSVQCVVPPVWRGALLPGLGTPGSCDGSSTYDLTDHWTQKPAQNPGPGSLVQAQFWFRDPLSTSNQTTSLSNAIEFPTCP
jgi:hypothetical protein